MELIEYFRNVFNPELAVDRKFISGYLRGESLCGVSSLSPLKNFSSLSAFLQSRELRPLEDLDSRGLDYLISG